MGLFTLLGNGVSFKNKSRSVLNALSDRFEDGTQVLRYPSDLGSVDKGHYIFIQINEQINTSFPGSQTGELTHRESNRRALRALFGNTTTGEGLGTAATTSAEVFKAVGEGAANLVVGNLGSAGQKLVEGFKQGIRIADESTGFSSAFKQVQSGMGVRTIRRITDTIALYMPDTLNFTYNQAYDTLNPGGSMAQTALSVLNSATETSKSGGNIKDQLRNASPFLANYFLRDNDVGRILFTAGTGGKVQNPMKEILYSSPDFRSFRFDFLMMPRSEKEALEVQNIIDLLRFHQAPEIVRNSGGFFMFPPSEFDISFQYNGNENVNIPKISTCVLTQIDTDYAPGGFAAYEVPGEMDPRLGRTGMPVSIRLTLGFTETEYLVKGSPLLSEKYNKRFNPIPPNITNNAVANDNDAMAAMRNDRTNRNINGFV